MFTDCNNKGSVATNGLIATKQTKENNKSKLTKTKLKS
jgi:hypothetical protein